jgi:hypothetical protein
VHCRAYKPLCFHDLRHRIMGTACSALPAAIVTWHAASC